ncbi:MAG: BatD family protein [Bacteroidales bacterium]
MQKIFIFLSFVLGFFNAAFTNDVSFQALAPEEVVTGERFQVSFQINARPSSFKAPEFSGFRVISGPNQSSSTSVQIINNQTTRTVTFTYSFVLESTQEGTFDIAPATAIIDGKGHRSDEISIKVIKASQQQSSSSSRQTQPSQGGQQPQQRASSDDLFIRANVSKSNPYQGEQIIITYKLYTRVSVSQYSVDKLPSFRNFWSENLTPSGNPQTSTEVVNGKTYRVAEIRRVAIFPQRSGELTIEPLEVELIVNLPAQRDRRSLFDEFFGGTSRQVRQMVASNRINLNVQPLPTQNRPANFSGMVGSDFNIEASVSPTELKVNDAATLEFTLSGRGNLRMTETPEFNFPANLEVFDPNINDNIRNTLAGISGSRTFSYLMIPRTGGEFVIPSLDFVYFDPAEKRYITRQTPEFSLQVEGSSAPQASSEGSQEDIQMLGQDIRFIKTGDVAFQQPGESFYGSPLFFILIIGQVLLFVVFLIILRNQIKLQGNQQLLRTRKAEKLARKRLKKAKGYLQQRNENAFYDEISKALWGYLSDKLSIPVSILNKENVEGAFKTKKVSVQLSENFIQTLDDCDFARFAPGEKEDKMEDIYQKALETIVMIEKELRNKKTAS